MTTSIGVLAGLVELELYPEPLWLLPQVSLGCLSRFAPAFENLSEVREVWSLRGTQNITFLPNLDYHNSASVIAAGSRHLVRVDMSEDFFAREDSM